MRTLAITVVAMCALPALGRAQPTLRIATRAPEGSIWARELHTWERGVEKESGGAVRVKLYFGGVAGDELEVGERIRRGQLDGIISTGTMCQQVAPSLRVMKVMGLFQDRDEASFVLGRLNPTFDKESQANGFVNLAAGGIGFNIIFSRKPVASMLDLRRTKLWTGLQDEILMAQLDALHLQAVPSPLDGAAAAYASGRIDGFLTPPSIALSWQWSAQAHYFSDLRLSYLFTCLLVSNASFDELSLEAQRAVRTAAAQLLLHSQQAGRELDDSLINGLFEKQGLTRVRADERFRSEFFAAVRAARDKLGDKLVPAPLMRQVQALLADYRAEHR